MEAHTARVLLTSLLQRIEPDPETSKYQLRGVISDHEIAAITFALGQLGGPIDELGKVPAAPMPLIAFESEVMGLTTPQNPGVSLCLDFGTAMSKGFAIREGKDGKLDLIPLRLGERAGEPQAIHPVSSSLWIDGQGRVFLGSDAVVRGQPSGDRRREDSLKRFLTLPSAGSDLDARLLPTAVNPIKEVPLTEEDAITLYFGYLTDLAANALQEEGISRYVRRRFAIPCWDKDRRDWGEGLLKTILARAAIIADHFHDKWKAGIPIDEAKTVLEAVKRLPGLPLFLVEQGISEPVAAGSSFLNLEEQIDRKLMIVVDVGAGTSDFAMFVVAKPRGSSQYAFNLIPGSTKALQQAGDQLDSALIDAILAKVALHPFDKQYEPVRNELQFRIRGIKEALCRDGSVTAALSNGAPFKVTRDEFLALPKAQEFGALLQQTFDEIIRSVDPSHFTHLSISEALEVLLTGGGARLDMVKALASGQVHVKDRIIQRQQANELPENLRRKSQSVRDDYPQLAVAIGGALPNPLSENDSGAIAPGYDRVEIGGFYQKGV